MTVRLVERGVKVLAVDRVEAWLERARARDLTGARFELDDLATFDLGRTFDHVIATNVAHEVPDLGDFLRRCRAHLGPDGLLHLSLQNPRSLHRLLGLSMGMISDLRAVSERGQDLETLRLLDADDLIAAGIEAGLDCIHRAGVMLKPLPNALMADLPVEILEGLLTAAPLLPEHGAMNYLVLRRS
jgi:2-polyprenyl-3-methyl-5-hydroxy-6-metoxy-1,4-benzoquinol methylase